MPPLPCYECDSEFLKLMMRQADVDLTVAALEIARDACPGLDFRPTLDWISARAAELTRPVSRTVTDAAALRLLAACLSGEHGLHGDACCFEQAEASYVNRVVETGRGIPISLSLVYIAVARRLGIELKGVAAPLHFLSRCDTPNGPLFVDAFNGGRIFTKERVTEWLCERTHMSPADVGPMLAEASPRAILIRVLNNLKSLHSRHENWRQAWLVQHRLTALQPAVYQERRDLAMLSVRANQPGPAVDLLQSCLRACPQEDRELLQRTLDEANGQLARWN